MKFILCFYLVSSFVGCMSLKNKAQSRQPESQNILLNCQQALTQAKQIKNKFLDEKLSHLELLRLFDKLLNMLDNNRNSAALSYRVNSEEKIKKEAQICLDNIDDFIGHLFIDNQAYEIIKKISEKENLPLEAQRSCEIIIAHFKFAGAHKSQKSIRAIQKLNKKIAKLEDEYWQNISTNRQEINLEVSDLLGLPKNYLRSYKINNDKKIKISTDFYDYKLFMSFAHSQKYRKELYIKYHERGKENLALLQKIREARHELARLHDYNSYADYVLSNSIAKNAHTAESFINYLAQNIKPGADKEYKRMLEYKQKFSANADVVEAYEKAYIQEALKRQQRNIEFQNIKKYFLYKNILNSILTLSAEIFDIAFQPVLETNNGEDSVIAYDIYNNKKLAGRIYLDILARSNKPMQPVQFMPLRTGLKDLVKPEAVLVGSLPALTAIDYEHVVQIFHEFGHALHHILSGNYDWHVLSKLPLETEHNQAVALYFAELARSYQALKRIAPISQDFVTSIKKESHINKALNTEEQLFYAALSLKLFIEDPKLQSIEHIVKNLSTVNSRYPYITDINFFHGYDQWNNLLATHYAFLWSQSLAYDFLGTSNGSGIIDLKEARNFKKTILEAGSRINAHAQIEQFLGRPYSFEPFVKWAMQEIERE